MMEDDEEYEKCQSRMNKMQVLMDDYSIKCLYSIQQTSVSLSILEERALR